MLEILTSASSEKLEGIEDNFCKIQLAATMTATDNLGRAAELATEELKEQHIFDLAGVVSVQFSTIYANICE